MGIKSRIAPVIVIVTVNESVITGAIMAPLSVLVRTIEMIDTSGGIKMSVDIILKTRDATATLMIDGTKIVMRENRGIPMTDGDTKALTEQEGANAMHVQRILNAIGIIAAA